MARHFFRQRDHAVGLLRQSAAVNGRHIDGAAGFFNERDRCIAGVFEEELHGAAFEIGDALHFSQINAALFRRSGKNCRARWARWPMALVACVAHTLWCGVVRWQKPAGETRELQRLSGADEGPADAFQRTARHEAADEAVFWREAMVFAQPLAHFDHGLVGHDLAWADFCAGFAEQAIVEGVAQRFFVSVELVLEESAHDGDLAARGGAVDAVDLVERANGGAGAAAVTFVDDGFELFVMLVVFHDHHRPKILPGLRMLFGSSACLMRSEASISSFSRAMPM